MSKGSRKQSKSKTNTIVQASSRDATLFYMGNHAEVVAGKSDTGPIPDRDDDIPFLIGSLAFLGRLDEAEFLFDKSHLRLNAEQVAASRFFLAVAFCRHSGYVKARAYLVTSMRAARHSRNPLLRFFVDQGVGFYRFFGGRYRDALRHARAALLAAMEADYAYGKFLATDLSGHSLVNAGHIAEGLAHLERALGLTSLLGNGGMAAATEIGLACYEAQFGLSGQETIARLLGLYDKLDPQNTYSRATLLLELSRQWTLRGDVAASYRYLDEACRIVYSLNNRRQSATFNHRHAYNLYLAGDYLSALNLIRLAKSEIHPAVDLVLDLQLSGLQLEICRKLAFTSEIERLEGHVTKLTVRTGSYIAGRILARHQPASLAVYPVGQDILGDLLDQTGADTSGLRILLDATYNTPVRIRLGLMGKQKAVVAAPALETVLVIDPPSTTSAGTAPSRQLKLLLRELGKGERTKEDLIRDVWGYKYHPGRHDPLIHQAMAKLRDILGECSRWLEFTGNGYRMHPLVQILVPAGAEEDVAVRSLEADSQASPSEARVDVGPRGSMILEYLMKHRFIDAKTCMELFQVSRVTASRDLALLHRKKAIRRFGSGRSTRYELGHQKE